ncbi:unnamed protein product [Rotaria magnacalcarata]
MVSSILKVNILIPRRTNNKDQTADEQIMRVSSVVKLKSDKTVYFYLDQTSDEQIIRIQHPMSIVLSTRCWRH